MSDEKRLEDQTASRRLRGRGIRRPLLGVTLLFVVALLGVVWLSHRRSVSVRAQGQALSATAKAGRVVQTATVGTSAPVREISLIAEARPFYSVALFARVSGYLTELRADIGDQVKRGQLLARVQSPEAELAYLSARADAMTKRRVADRARVLLRRKFMSQQEADLAFAAADIAEANLRTQEVVRGYQDVTAPFDGRITERLVDPGALIQNASASQGAPALFSISQTDRLRVFVYVDQKDAPFVHEKDPVVISLPGQPGLHFDAEVHQLAGQLDPRTRTLLAEIVLDNSQGRIVAGSFVNATMRVGAPASLEVPAQALVMKGNEAFVPVVQPDGRIHYAKVELTENDGKSARIRSGVRLGERVALNVGSSLQESQVVRPLPAQDQMSAGTVAPTGQEPRGP